MPRPSATATNIFRRMEEREISPAELARRLDIDESYFSRLKNGSIREPSRRRLVEIANALGTTADILVEGMPRPSTDEVLSGRVMAALGPEKSHLAAAAIEAALELPANERDHFIDVLHTLATNWPTRRG